MVSKHNEIFAVKIRAKMLADIVCLHINLISHYFVGTRKEDELIA